MSPAEYAQTYAKLKTWYWDTEQETWSIVDAPIINYLKANNDGSPPDGGVARDEVLRKIAAVTKIPGVTTLRTFNYDDYDYINNSIRRCFIGKGCPWEIQETLQIASQVGLFATKSLRSFCLDKLGVDCGGFVANYWGEACPHMNDVGPLGWNGMAPRYFWETGRSRRRPRASEVRMGDAVIFFEGNLANPDKADSRGAGGAWTNVGSRAFHIAVVNEVGQSAGEFTNLSVAESAGSPSQRFGGNGVNVRAVDITGTGSFGGWVRCHEGSGESAHHMYFVAPPPGWGPEEAYKLG
jgi:hypothetical protein